MKDGSTLAQAVEGIILFKDFAFNELGFDKDLFDVRKQNKKVCNYSEPTPKIIFSALPLKAEVRATNASIPCFLAVLRKDVIVR